MRRRAFITALGSAALGAALGVVLGATAMTTSVAALEAPKPEPAQKFLGRSRQNLGDLEF
jgi:hypothetical protein